MLAVSPLELLVLIGILIAVVYAVRAARRRSSSSNDFGEDEPLPPTEGSQTTPFASSTEGRRSREIDRGEVFPTPARRLASPVEVFWESALRGIYVRSCERGLSDDECMALDMVVATLVMPPWPIGAEPDASPPQLSSVRSRYGRAISALIRTMPLNAATSFDALPLYQIVVANDGDAVEVQHAASMIFCILSERLESANFEPQRARLERWRELAGCHAWNMVTRGGDPTGLPPPLVVWVSDRITDGESGLPARTSEGRRFMNLETLLDAWTPERLNACADLLSTSTGLLRLFQLSLRQRAFERCDTDTERGACLASLSGAVCAQMLFAPTEGARDVIRGIHEACEREARALAAR